MKSKIKSKDKPKSLIWALIQNFVELIYSKARNSFFASILCSYFGIEAKVKQGLTYKFIPLCDRLKTKMKPANKKLAHILEKNKIIDFLKNFIFQIYQYRTKDLGMFISSIGLYSIIGYLIKRYTFVNLNASLYTLYFGIIILMLSFKLLFSKKSICTSICDSRFFSFLFFDVIGVGHHILYRRDCGKSHFNEFLIFGMIFGVIGFFINPISLFGILFFSVVIYTIFNVCEFGVIVLLLCIPFLNMKLVTLTAIITLASYILKCLKGKRSFKFKLTDVFMLAFAAIILSGAVFSYANHSAFSLQLTMLLFVCAYFLTSNIIKTPVWTKRCLGSICISAFFASLIMILNYLCSSVEIILYGVNITQSIGQLISDISSDATALNEYLTVIFPIVLITFFETKKNKFGYFITVLLSFTAIILTSNISIYISLTAIIVLSLIFYGNQFITFVITFMPAILCLLVFIPEKHITDFFTDNSALTRSFSTMKGSLELFRNKFISGIGTGTSAFSAQYPRYAVMGTENAADSSNLFLQIGIETGIASLVIFILIIFFAVSMSLSYYNYYGRRTSLAPTMCVIAFLVRGMLTYVWSDYRMLLLFFLVLGICVGLVTQLKHDEDIKKMYLR